MLEAATAEGASRSKGQIALAELDRVRAAGARFGCVLADAGCGTSAAFRHGLTNEAVVGSGRGPEDRVP